MESVVAFRPLPIFFAPCRNHPSSIFATANRRIRIQTSSASKTPRNSIPIPFNLRPSTFPEPSRSSTEKDEEWPGLSAAERISQKVVLALFCFTISFGSFRGPRAIAVAAPAVSEVVLEQEESLKGGHEYSKHTKRLLETVSVLLKSVEEARRGNGAKLKAVEAALKAVRAKEEELQEEIMGGLHEELRREKEVLVKRSDEVFDEVVKVKRDLEKLGGNVGTM